MTWIIALLSSVVSVNTGLAEPSQLPKIIMVEVEDITPNDDELYQAISAQLSDAPLQLSRISTVQMQTSKYEPQRIAAQTAADYQATLVFWIQDDGTTVTLYFFGDDATKGLIYARALDITTSARSSRFETIGIAVATVIEEAIAHLAKKPPPPPLPEPPPPPKEEPPPPKRSWVELLATYEGSLFSSRTVTHGVKMGFGLFPIKRIALSLAYTFNGPLTVGETERYRLTLTPRHLEASIALRLTKRSLDIRLGAACSVDIRSFALDSLDEDISPRREALEGVVAIGPFLGVTWRLLDNVGITTGVAANIAVNERIYDIKRDDETTVEVLRPYLVKFVYRIGLAVQL